MMEKESDKKEMENTEFVKDCIAAEHGTTITRETLTFDELFNLKYPAQCKKDPKWMFFWSRFSIFATTKKDYTMRVWNGKHPVEENQKEHICKSGSKVRIWMVSRMGDIGITDNLTESAKGYDCRGIDNEDLCDWQFVKNSSNDKK